MDIILNIIKSVIFGIVQGVTEFLPISSTGHLILLQTFMPLNVFADPVKNKAFWDVYKVVIQFGSILFYCKRLCPLGKNVSEPKKKNIYHTWLMVVVASVPLVAGMLLNDWIDNVMSAPYVISITLILYGILFIWMENREKKYTIEHVSQITAKKAFGVGMFQILALIPGTSRSGSTIFGATLLGFNRSTAAEFSFFMAIPAMFGASLLKILKADFSFGFWPLMILLIGTVVSFIVSIIAIRTLMNYIRKNDFKVFGIYRIILGIIVLILCITRLIA